MLKLTRLEIITQGLALAGRPDLVSDARLWLSMFLEEMYVNQDLEWLEKYVTAIPVVQDTPVPCDYRAAKSAILIHPNGSKSVITSLTKSEEIDSKIMQMVTSKAAPRYFYVDQALRTMRFIPEPDQVYSMNLRYYFVPEIGDPSNSYADGDYPAWGLPVSILIDHIKSRAFEYNDDQRQGNSDVQVKNKLAESKMNNHDRRAGPSRTQLGKRFKKRF